MQVLRNEAIGYAADLWALGCLLYRMLVGSTPFAAASEYLIFERISSHDLQIPDSIPASARDLLTQLLDDESAKRIGRHPGAVELSKFRMPLINHFRSRQSRHPDMYRPCRCRRQGTCRDQRTRLLLW